MKATERPIHLATVAWGGKLAVGTTSSKKTLIQEKDFVRLRAWVQH